jgi:hypothetical protein
VEWADIVEDVLPAERLTIEFEPTADSPDERRITITYPDKYRPLIAKLESDWVEVEP